MRRIVAIEAQSFGSDAWTAGIFRWYADHFPALLLVAKMEARTVGYVAASRRRLTGEIDSIAVDLRWRRKGIASALLVAVLRRFRRMGAASAGLMVRPTNTPAVAAYRQLGFVRRATLPRYYSDGGRAWRMKLFLARSSAFR